MKSKRVESLLKQGLQTFKNAGRRVLEQGKKVPRAVLTALSKPVGSGISPMSWTAGVVRKPITTKKIPSISDLNPAWSGILQKVQSDNPELPAAQEYQDSLGPSLIWQLKLDSQNFLFRIGFDRSELGSVSATSLFVMKSHREADEPEYIGFNDFKAPDVIKHYPQLEAALNRLLKSHFKA